MSDFPIEVPTSLFREFPQLRTALVNSDYDRAIEHLQQAFNTLMEQKRYRDALTMHEAILQSLTETIGSNELRLWCLLGIGNARFHLDQDTMAETAYMRMRDEARDVDDHYLHAVALARLGDLAQKRGLTDTAERFYQESIETRFEIGDFLGTVETLLYLAGLREESGQREWADLSLKAAEKIYKSLRHADFEEYVHRNEQAYQRLGMAILFQQASLKRAEGKLSGAARIYRKALKVAQERHDPHTEAKLLQNIANLEVEQGRTFGALPLYRTSLSLAQTHGFGQTSHEVQLGLAIALFRLKRYDESVSFYESVCEATKESGDLQQWASLATDAGAACVEAEQTEKARGFLDGALTYFRSTDNHVGQEQVMHNLLVMDARQRDTESLQARLHEYLNTLPQSAFASRGSLYRLVGNLCLNVIGDAPGAARYFGQAVEEAAAVGNAHEAGQTAALAAAGLSDVGAFQESLLLFDRSADIFTQIDDIANLWRTRNDRGNVFAYMEYYEEAVEEYTWCLQTARERRDQILEAQVLLNFCEVTRRMGEMEESLSHIERALFLYRTMEDQEGELSALNGMGMCLLEIGQYKALDRTDEAFVFYEQALKLAKNRKDRAEEAMATRGLANIAERRNDVSTALRLFLRAADLWEREGDVAHCAEALASRVTLQVIQFDPRRWQRDTDRLVQVAIRAGRIGTASRGIAGAAGYLMQAGLWEAAASVARLAISLHEYRYPTVSTAQDAQIVEREASADLYDILVYLIDGMELWMSPEDRPRFLESLTSPENFATLSDGADLRESIASIREELIAQNRYSQP